MLRCRIARSVHRGVRKSTTRSVWHFKFLKVMPKHVRQSDFILSGFRDWYRFPLKYPYSFSRLTLERDVGSVRGSVQNPRRNGNPCLEYYQLLPEKISFLFQTLSYDQKQKTYGILSMIPGNHSKPIHRGIQSFTRNTASRKTQMQSPGIFFFAPSLLIPSTTQSPMMAYA